MSTVEELRDYVENTLDVRTTTRMTKVELQAIIDGKEDVAAEESKPAVLPDNKKDKKKVKIILSSKGDDMTPLFVGVNGYGYTIQRDIEVEVPESVVHVLDNAIESKLNADNVMVDVRAHQYTRL